MEGTNYIRFFKYERSFYYFIDNKVTVVSKLEVYHSSHSYMHKGLSLVVAKFNSV